MRFCGSVIEQSRVTDDDRTQSGRPPWQGPPSGELETFSVLMVATFKCTHLGAGTGVDPGWIPTVCKLPVGEGGDGAVEEHGLGTMLRRESPLDLVINWVWKAQARNASKMTPRWPVAFLEILKAALCNHPHSLAGLASKLLPLPAL